MIVGHHHTCCCWRSLNMWSCSCCSNQPFTGDSWEVLCHSMCWSQRLLITFSVFLSIPGSESPGNKPDLARNVSNTSCSKFPGGLSSLCAVISIILPCNTTCKQRSWPPSVNDSPWSFSSGRRWWKRIKAVRVTFLPKKIVFTPCSANGVSPGGQAYSAEGADFHCSWCCGW